MRMACTNLEKQQQAKQSRDTIRKSNRIARQPRRSRLFHHKDFIMSVKEKEDPKAYDEAITCDDSDEWKKVMDKKIRALQENNTWTLVPLSAGRLLVQNGYSKQN